MSVKITNLSFAYDGRPVLEDINLDIRPGKFTVLLGRNGSGKSTIFKLIAGLLKCRKGKIQIHGKDADELSLTGRAKVLGFLSQHHRAVFPFSVADVVLTGRASYVNLLPKPEDRRIADQAMKEVGIRHLRERAFTELSGGEQQLVMIARVLAQEPKIILLDEPTTHLDFVNANRLLALVRSLTASGMTIIAVLHDPNQAFLYGDEFVYLHNGHILTPESGQAPWSREVLQTVYGADVQTVPFNERALVVPAVTPTSGIP